MSENVITSPPHQTLAEARALLQRHRIRHLPVVRKRRLVGIVSDCDLRGAPATAKTLADVMTSKPIVIGSNASADEAARLLRMHRIDSLPVVDGTKLVGILTASDILDAFVDVSGVGEGTYRIVVSGVRGRQAAQRVRSLIQNGHGELKWIHPDSREAGKLHVRLKAQRIDDIVTALEAAGFDVNALVAPSSARR